MNVRECEKMRAACAVQRRTAFRWASGLMLTVMIAIIGSSVAWALKTSNDSSANHENIKSNTTDIQEIKTTIKEDIGTLRTEQRRDMGDIRKRLDKVIFMLKPSNDGMKRMSSNIETISHEIIDGEMIFYDPPTRSIELKDCLETIDTTEWHSEKCRVRAVNYGNVGLCTCGQETISYTRRDYSASYDPTSGTMPR